MNATPVLTQSDSLEADAVTAWLVQHQKHTLWAILLLSLLIRLLYFTQLSNGPCVWQHRWDQSDMHCFDGWAKQIAAGDWLTSQGFHPYHDWQKELVSEYLKKNPEIRKALQVEIESRGDTIDPERFLFKRWNGDKQFFQDPFYPYLLALVYSVFGPDPVWVFLIQLAAGILTNVLVYLIARTYFGELAGVIAGSAAVLCGPLLYYEMVLLRDSFVALAGLAVVYVTDVARTRDLWRWWFLNGITLGLAILCKSIFLPLAVLILMGLAWERRKPSGAWIKPVIGVLAGLLLCSAPVIARNVAVGARPLALAGGGGAGHFVCANAYDCPPTAGGLTISHQHLGEIVTKTDNRLIPAMIETLKTHPSGWTFFAYLWGKFALVWHWYEMPNNSNFYYYRLHAGVLEALPVTFWVLAPFSLLGLFLGAGTVRRSWPLFLLIFCHLAILVVFGVLSRYRLPLLAAVIPFAALATIRLFEWARVRQKRLKFLIALLALVAIFRWTSRPLPDEVPLIRPADYEVAYLVHYQREAASHAEAGDWARAAHVLNDSLRFEPDAVREMDQGRPPFSVAEAQIANVFFRARLHTAVALRNAGDIEQADQMEKRARLLRQLAVW